MRLGHLVLSGIYPRVLLPQRSTFPGSRNLSQKRRPMNYGHHTGPDARPRSQKSGIPELLRIYHVRGKTIAVGVLKLVPLVFLGTNVILRGYAAFMEPSAELFKEASIALGASAIPLLYILLSAPFVSTVHMRLPVHARASRDALLRFADNPPAATRLQLTTISWYGYPRSTSVALSELHPMKPRLSIANVIWKPNHSVAKDRWLHKQQTEFLIGNAKGSTLESQVGVKVFAKIGGS